MGIEPITRKEMFMASAAGESVATPTPVTREEYFLSKIGGGGVQSDWDEQDETSPAFILNKPKVVELSSYSDTGERLFCGVLASSITINEASELLINTIPHVRDGGSVVLNSRVIDESSDDPKILVVLTEINTGNSPVLVTNSYPKSIMGFKDSPSTSTSTSTSA